MLHKPILTQSKAWLLYICLLTLMAGCSKCNKVVEPAQDPASTAGLPAATETGAGTFGCMVNGKAWLPVRDNTPLARSNPNLIYDATFEGGSFSLSGEIYADKRSQEWIAMGGRGIGAVGEYNLTNSGVGFTYVNYSDSVSYNTDEDIATGKIIITKLDKTNNIIAGTFSFTIEKRDTGKKVTVTDGRFDMKYL